MGRIPDNGGQFALTQKGLVDIFKLDGSIYAAARQLLVSSPLKMLIN